MRTCDHYLHIKLQEEVAPCCECTIETLESALKDIVLGADMMLDSRPMASLHSYAAEVKRVAKAAISTDHGEKS